METPLKLELQGIKATDYVRELIADNLSKIERRYGRATACRIVVRAPNGHHRSGEPYSVSMRIALPAGREIIVGHIKTTDSRFTDLTFAINDAFKRALRQLREETAQLNGRARRHAARVPAEAI
jgi:ribosome-associated translation inhibitor RaiA